MTVDEIQKLDGLYRGREIIHYPQYLLGGGQVFPLSVLQETAK